MSEHDIELFAKNLVHFYHLKGKADLLAARKKIHERIDDPNLTWEILLDIFMTNGSAPQYVRARDHSRWSELENFSIYSSKEDDERKEFLRVFLSARKISPDESGINVGGMGHRFATRTHEQIEKSHDLISARGIDKILSDIDALNGKAAKLLFAQTKLGLASESQKRFWIIRQDVDFSDEIARNTTTENFYAIGKDVFEFEEFYKWILLLMEGHQVQLNLQELDLLCALFRDYLVSMGLDLDDGVDTLEALKVSCAMNRARSPGFPTPNLDSIPALVKGVDEKSPKTQIAAIFIGQDVLDQWEEKQRKTKNK